MRKIALAMLCCATAAASCWLVTMYFVLQHPGYTRRAFIAGLFVAQSVLTLVGVAGWIQASWFRFVVMAGGLAITWAGASALRSSFSDAHFEGFAVIIASALVVQGLLTLWQFAVPQPAVARN